MNWQKNSWNELKWLDKHADRYHTIGMTCDTYNTNEGSKEMEYTKERATVIDLNSSYFGKTGEVVGVYGGKVRLLICVEDRRGNKSHVSWHFSENQIHRI